MVNLTIDKWSSFSIAAFMFYMFVLYLKQSELLNRKETISLLTLTFAETYITCHFIQNKNKEADWYSKTENNNIKLLRNILNLAYDKGDILYQMDENDGYFNECWGGQMASHLERKESLYSYCTSYIVVNVR